MALDEEAKDHYILTLEYTALSLCGEMGGVPNWILLSASSFNLPSYAAWADVYEETLALHKCVDEKGRAFLTAFSLLPPYGRTTPVSRKSTCATVSVVS